MQTPEPPAAGSPSAADLRETVDYIAIRRLQDAYGDIATRRAWPELAGIFAPDIRVTVDAMTGDDPIVLETPQTVGAWIGAAIERFDHFQFVVLGTRVHLGAEAGDAGRPADVAVHDHAVARMYINEIRHDRDTGRQTMAYGVYHDRFRRTDGRWRFAARHYRSLARTAADFDVFPFPRSVSIPGFPGLADA